MKRDFLTIHDFSKSELLSILDLASDLKKNKIKDTLKGKVLAMIFEKPSNRTRVSFDVGMFQLGGHAINLEPSSIQLGGRESIADVARTLSRFVDGVMLRTFSHKTIEEFAKYATVPIINGLTDYNHPCQAVADIMTILEKKSSSSDSRIKLTYIGDGNNVLHSLINITSLLDIELVAACPKDYVPLQSVIDKAKKISGKDLFKVVEDPIVAVKNADAIYTDVWASMGQEDEIEMRKKLFSEYQVNSKLVSHAKSDAIVMHCLPAHRGDEITDNVVDSAQSVVFDQAENRLHAQKAILVKLMKGF
jgi:ornithine carbamoyltransferase